VAEPIVGEDEVLISPLLAGVCGPCGDCSECRIGATNLCTTYNEIGFTRPGAGALRSDVTDDEPRGKVVIALT